MRVPVQLIVAVALVAGGLVVAPASLATAAAEPSFRVVCKNTRTAADDPIVFPGQPGLSHMHTFFGARSVDASTSPESLLGTATDCGREYGDVDFSAYWIPALYRNDQLIDYSKVELAVYYKRAGANAGVLANQALPRGLRIIAGDMMSAGPQEAVYYKCAKAKDAGQQSKLGRGFPSCASDEMLIAELKFPDCWDGRNLDSANHRSHMAYSGGSDSRCPSTHPVKVPQMTFEAWFHGVEGAAASSLKWASGGQYSFHGDVMSAWDTLAAANLVNQCINTARDCNPLNHSAVPVGTVTQAQIDAQLVGVANAAPTTSGTQPTTPGHESHLALSSQTPTISGTAKVGRKLTAKPGTWGPAQVTLAYGWYRDGTPIAGAGRSTYTLVGADRGKAITVAVTGSKAGYMTSTRTSKPTKSVAAGTLATIPKPKIAGSAKVGRTLTVKTGAWAPKPITLKYTWYRGTKVIKGATKVSYLLTRVDRAKKIKVKVTGSKLGYLSVSKKSKASAKVR